MSATRFRYLAIAVRLAAVVFPCAIAAQGAQLPPPIELRVPKPPTVGGGENGSFIAYELHVTNFGMQPLTLRNVEVSDANFPLGTEGVPYLYNSFELVGHCQSFYVGCRLEMTTARQREIPLQNAIVRFP